MIITNNSFYAILKSMENKIKIGLIGLGTVGSGVYKTLQNFDNIDELKNKKSGLLQGFLYF